VLFFGLRFNHVAKPSTGFFGDFWNKISEYVHYLELLGKEALLLVGVILDIKAEVNADFEGLLQELKDALQESTDFAQRVKTLRTHAIRADIVFQFIEDLRTGELKKFCVDTLGTMHSDLAHTMDEIAAAGSSLKILKNPGVGVLNFLSKIITIWSAIATIVKALHGIVPVVKAFADKLAEFEGVIMKQTNPRIRLKKTISARQGKLHASA
jgi:hypothetical protein